MNDLRTKVLALITSIRESHIDSVYLYTQGQCYAFHKILKSVFGDQVECWYDSVEGHVYSKIGDYWYDIRGEYANAPGTYEHIEDVMRSDHPENWGKRDTRRLIDLARPTLEEAKDLTDFRPLKNKFTGIRRGELFVLNSMDSCPIWEVKEPLTVVDVLELAERKGYNVLDQNKPLGRLLNYINDNFRPRYTDTGIGYQLANHKADVELIKLAEAVGKVN